MRGLVSRTTGYWRRYRAGLTGFAALAIAVAPLFVIGVLSVPIRHEFDESRASLGLAVSAFMGAAVLCAPISGRLVDRHGVNVVLRLGIISVLASDLWVGVFASGSTQLRIGMALGGVGLSLVDAGSTIDVKHEVQSDAQAMAFGIKETAGPLTTLLGGLLIIPLATATSWRVIFLIYAALAAGLLVVDLALDRDHGRRSSISGDPLAFEPMSRARAVAVAVALAMVGVTAVTTYGVDAAVVSGMTAQRAGLWITIGSIGAIVTRMVTALVASRSEPRGAAIVPLLVLLGGCGHVLLALGPDALMGWAEMIALVFGWGWGGVLFLYVIRLFPIRSGRAMGTVFMGAYAGGVVGPPIFGWITDHMGFSAAWLLSALSMGVAAAILIVALTPIRHARSFH